MGDDDDKWEPWDDDYHGKNTLVKRKSDGKTGRSLNIAVGDHILIRWDDDPMLDKSDAQLPWTPTSEVHASGWGDEMDGGGKSKKRRKSKKKSKKRRKSKRKKSKKKSKRRKSSKRRR